MDFEEFGSGSLAVIQVQCSRVHCGRSRRKGFSGLSSRIQLCVNIHLLADTVEWPFWLIFRFLHLFRVIEILRSYVKLFFAHYGELYDLSVKTEVQLSDSGCARKPSPLCPGLKVQLPRLMRLEPPPAHLLQIQSAQFLVSRVQIFRLTGHRDPCPIGTIPSRYLEDVRPTGEPSTTPL